MWSNAGMANRQGDVVLRFARLRPQLTIWLGLDPCHSSYLPAYEDGTECFETSAYKIRTPGNYSEENIEHSEHGESLKSRISLINFHTLKFN
jgi:hypothetical protein